MNMPTALISASHSTPATVQPRPERRQWDSAQFTIKFDSVSPSSLDSREGVGRILESIARSLTQCDNSSAKPKLLSLTVRTSRSETPLGLSSSPRRPSCLSAHDRLPDDTPREHSDEQIGSTPARSSIGTFVISKKRKRGTSKDNYRLKASICADRRTPSQELDMASSRETTRSVGTESFNMTQESSAVAFDDFELSYILPVARWWTAHCAHCLSVGLPNFYHGKDGCDKGGRFSADTTGRLEKRLRESSAKKPWGENFCFTCFLPPTLCPKYDARGFRSSQVPCEFPKLFKDIFAKMHTKDPSTPIERAFRQRVQDAGHNIESQHGLEDHIRTVSRGSDGVVVSQVVKDIVCVTRALFIVAGT